MFHKSRFVPAQASILFFAACNSVAGNGLRECSGLVKTESYKKMRKIVLGFHRILHKKTERNCARLVVCRKFELTRRRVNLSFKHHARTASPEHVSKPA